MKKENINLLRHYTSFNKIINKVDVLHNFYISTYELLWNEYSLLKDTKRDELFVIEKLDSLTSDLKKINETKRKVTIPKK